MDTKYKKEQGLYDANNGHATLLQDSIQHEAAQQDDSHQQQVNLFDLQQYDTQSHSSGAHPHAPVDHSPHQHAPNHPQHESTNPSSGRRYLRDPDTGLWVNQVRSGQ